MLIKCLFFLMIFSSTANAQNKFTISGHVKDVADGEIIWLYRNNGSVLTGIISDTVFDGSFSFPNIIENETSQYALRGEGNNFPPLFLDIWVSPNAAINIEGQNYLIKTWKVSSKVAEQQEANRYLKPNIKNWNQIQKISIKQNQLQSQIKKSASDEETQQLKSKSNSLTHIKDSLHNEIANIEISVLQSNPVSEIWLNKLNQIARQIKYDPESPYKQQALQLYKCLSPPHLKSRIGTEITGLLFPPKVVQKGDVMADADLIDLLDKKQSLSNYKGKYLLLDFWSFGCGPCIAAMPELKTISDSLKDKLTIIGINTDTERKLWRKISEKENVSWINLNDHIGMAGLAAKYGVNGIPHYVIISPKGIVLGSWTGYEKGKVLEYINETIL